MRLSWTNKLTIDLWIGWRHQIVYLVQLGFHVIVPSMLGYDRTSKPNNAEAYGFKSIASNLVELLELKNVKRAIWIGHDWGSMVVQRVALYYPSVVIAVATICVPFIPPRKTYSSLENLAAADPRFSYQLYFRDHAERECGKDRENTRVMLNGMFRTEKEAVAERGLFKFNVRHGMLDQLRKVKTLSAMWKDCPQVWQYYLNPGFARGLPYLWYATTDINYRDELPLVNKKINVPALFIGAENDVAAPKGSKARLGQTELVPSLVTVELENASHWCLQLRPQQCNKALGDWLALIVPTTSNL